MCLFVKKTCDKLPYKSLYRKKIISVALFMFLIKPSVFSELSITAKIKSSQDQKVRQKARQNVDNLNYDEGVFRCYDLHRIFDSFFRYGPRQPCGFRKSGWQLLASCGTFAQFLWQNLLRTIAATTFGKSLSPEK